MRPVTITRALVAADANGIAEAQQTAGEGDLTLNGAFVVAGVAQLGQQRKVGIASTGNLSALTFTVYGTNDAGNVISEARSGPSNNTVSTTLDFATVTRVSVSGAVGTDVEVGTTDVGASLPIPLDIYLPFGNTASVDVTGTVNYSVQVTNSDPFGDPSTPLNWVAYPGGGLTSQTADATASTAVAYRAARLVTNSGTGSAALTVTQQGLMV